MPTKTATPDPQSSVRRLEAGNAETELARRELDAGTAERRHKAESRHLLAWCAMPLFASANGAIRDATYARLMSYTLSHSLAVLPLLAVIGAWAAFVGRRWPLPDGRAGARVGATWLALTLGFEFGLGMLRNVPLADMVAEYDVTRGHLWPLVPLAVALAPELVRRWRTFGAMPFRP